MLLQSSAVALEKKGPRGKEGVQPWERSAWGEVRGKCMEEGVEGSRRRSSVKLRGTPMAFDLTKNADLIEVGEGVLGDSFDLP